MKPVAPVSAMSDLAIVDCVPSQSKYEVLRRLELKSAHSETCNLAAGPYISPKRPAGRFQELVYSLALPPNGNQATERN